jgi:hypothetical protein
MPKKKTKKAAKKAAKKAKASSASTGAAGEDTNGGGPSWGDFRDGRLQEWVPQRRHAQWNPGDEEPSKPWLREAYRAIKDLFEAVERLERVVHLGDPGFPYGVPNARKEQGEPIIITKPGGQGGKNPPPPPPCFP